MSEDIVFKFQLGLILPKLREKIGESLNSIVSELVDIVHAGLMNDDEVVNIDEVKQLIMKDLEIFLDNEILPSIHAKLDSAKGASSPDATEEESGEETAES